MEDGGLSDSRAYEEVLHSCNAPKVMGVLAAARFGGVCSQKKLELVALVFLDKMQR